MSVRFSGWKVDDRSFNHHIRGSYNMYHGTSVANARLIIANGFQPSKDGLLGKGVYVTGDITKACNYPKKSPNCERVVLKVTVRPGRVKCIRKVDDPMLITWNNYGCDSAWLLPNCNCVLDPKRVEVVGISRAPNTAVERELLALLRKKGKDQEGRDEEENVCALCKRKTHRAVPHITQRCWNCQKPICSLMIEHKCPASP